MADPVDLSRASLPAVAAPSPAPASDALTTSGGLIPIAPAMSPHLLVPPPRRARLTVRVVVGLLVMSAVAVGGWLSLWQPVTVAVVQPRRGVALEAIYATGIVEAIDTSRVGSTVSGRLTAVLVQEGDSVRAGQPLAQLDDRQAAQRLDDARARLALAAQELARDRALVPTGSRSVQALQRSVAEQERAAAAVALAEREQGEYRVVAPLDGIVMKREVDPGNTVAANAALFTVASTARLRIAADVDERDIAQVKLGATVAIRADAYPGEAFSAHLTNIRRQGDSATRTFRVEADLPADSKLFIGMTVDVNIVVAEHADALLLPPAAVLHDPPRGGLPGQAFVFRAEQGQARRADVELGAVGEAAVEVRKGLPPDSTVIANPTPGLANGARVRIAP